METRWSVQGVSGCSAVAPVGLAGAPCPAGWATAVTSSEKGVWVGLGATAGAALIVGATAGLAELAGPPSPLAVSAGTITLTTSATNTGAFSWYLAYIPLDTGASVS